MPRPAFPPLLLPLLLLLLLLSFPTPSRAAPTAPPMSSVIPPDEEDAVVLAIMEGIAEAVRDAHSKLEDKERGLALLKKRGIVSGDGRKLMREEIAKKEAEIAKLKETFKRASETLKKLDIQLGDEKNARAALQSRLKEVEDMHGKVASEHESTKKQRDKENKKNQEERKRLLRDLETEKINNAKILKQVDELTKLLNDAKTQSLAISPSEFMKKHAAAFGDFLDSPEATALITSSLEDAAASAASAASTVQSLQSRLSASIDALYASSYSSTLATLLILIALFVPLYCITAVTRRFTKTMSIHHWVYLFYCFTASLFGSCLIVSLITSRDPLYTLLRTSRKPFLAFCLSLSLQAVLLLALVTLSVLRSGAWAERISYLTQLCAYGLIVHNFRHQVWIPVLKGKSFPPLDWVHYAGYTALAALMLGLLLLTGADDSSTSSRELRGVEGDVTKRTTDKKDDDLNNSGAAVFDIPISGDTPSVLRAVARRMGRAVDLF